MKKYLMTAATALVLGGLMTSCTKDLDSGGSSSISQNAKESYKEAFVSTFGMPVEGLDWGFGPGTNAAIASTRAMTRVDKPTKPSFRDGTNNLPDFSKPDIPTFYNTVAEAKTAGVTIIAAEGKTIDPQHNIAYSINSSTTFNQLQNFSGITLYVTENTTFSPSFSANGNTIIVTKDKKLTLKAINEKVNVYLAPGAELDLSEYSGNISFNNNGSGTPYKLYLSPGSKITGGNICVDNGYQVLNNGGKITSTSIRVQKSTLWNEGKIALSGDLWSYNGFANIFNAEGDTISVGGKLELTNNNDLLYNNGYIPITGDIKMKDGSNEIVNNGILNSSSDLDMKAGGKFHNVGYATISGRSYIYNTNSYWVNDGHYTTGTFDDQNCEKVFNNCYMTVTGDFHLGVPAAANGHSFFTIEGGGEGERESGAYVYCGGNFIYGGNTDLWLGNKSYLEVIGEFKSTNINKPYGVHGPESGSYAVIKAGSFTQDNNAKAAERCITFFGKLYIDAPIQYNNYVAEGTDVQFSSSHPEKPVSIPPTDCSPGYNSNVTPPTPPVTPVTNKVRVIAEDLSMNDGKPDFDFNDVVFDVDLLSNGKVRITLLAAGGTLPLTVGDPTTELQSPTMEMQYDTQGEKMGEVMTYEVHHQFKVSTTTMVNTNAAGGANRDAVEILIDNPSTSSDILDIANAIPIRVFKGGEWIELEKAVPVGTRTEQLTASKVAVDGTFGWCAERVNITQDPRYQYASYKGNQKSRFELYLEGKLTTKWWDQNSIATE